MFDFVDPERPGRRLLRIVWGGRAQPPNRKEVSWPPGSSSSAQSFLTFPSKVWRLQALRFWAAIVGRLRGDVHSKAQQFTHRRSEAAESTLDAKLFQCCHFFGSQHDVELS